MNCINCGGDLKWGTTPFHLDRKGVHVSLDYVPAWVCTQCGEAMFETAEVDSMQAILREIEKNAPQAVEAA